MIRLTSSSISTFQWSTSEQVYPFEKALDGSTLYCKQLNFGALPNTGTKAVAHGIPNFLPSKLHRVQSLMYDNASGALPFPHPYQVGSQWYVEATNFTVWSPADWTGFTLLAQLIYKH